MPPEISGLSNSKKKGRSNKRETDAGSSKSEDKRQKTIKSYVSDLSAQWWRVPELTAAEYAEEAIECHRIFHGLQNPSHKLVKPLSCRRFMSCIPEALDFDGVRDFCHVSFIATPTNSDCRDQVLIFVELSDGGYEELDVRGWFELELDGPGITNGCGFCPHEDEYPHPSHGNYIGVQCAYKPADEASQQELSQKFKLLFEFNKKQKYKPVRCQIVYDDTPPPQSTFCPKLSNDEFAELAVSYINDKENAEFELVQTLGCRRQMLMMDICYQDWCHVCFLAKDKNAGADDSPVQFFVELCDPGVNKVFILGCYSRVDPSDSVKTEKGCGICPANDNYIHPTTINYEAGDFPPLCYDNDF